MSIKEKKKIHPITHTEFIKWGHSGAGWALNPLWWCPCKKMTMWTKTHRQGEDLDDVSVSLGTSGLLETTKARRWARKEPAQSLQQRASLVTSRSETSGLQECERMGSWCWKSRGLWNFVRAALRKCYDHEEAWLLTCFIIKTRVY